MIAEGRSSHLKASVGGGALHVRLMEIEQRPAAERLLAAALEVPIRLEADPAALSATVGDPQRVAHALSELAHAGIEVANFALGQPSLDEVFLTLTGRPAEDQTVEPVDAGPQQPAEEVAP